MVNPISLSPPRVLMVHNFYQQPGGEDQVFQAELDLLQSHQIPVTTYTIHNRQIESRSPLSVARDTLWNSSSYHEIETLIQTWQPDVVHVHNTFPLMSPSIYYAARAHQIPVVQTLHNYRLLCPNALFFRDQKPCEDCLGKPLPWPGIYHRCYRDQWAASTVVGSSLTLHNILGTYKQQVNLFIALTAFARQKYIEGGIPADAIALKPNFVSTDPGFSSEGGNTFVYIGRLAPEKGLNTLLKAWQLLGGEYPLQIVGEGPLRSKVEQATQTLPGIQYLGHRPLAEIFELLGHAKALIFPSEWYETFGRVIIEAYAKGTPVITSALGVMNDLVHHQQTGLKFEPGSAQDLATQIRWSLQSPAWPQMRYRARQEYTTHYTAERNYNQLRQLYDQVRLQNLSSPVPTDR